MKTKLGIEYRDLAEADTARDIACEHIGFFEDLGLDGNSPQIRGEREAADDAQEAINAFRAQGQ